MSSINILDCTLRDGGYINHWKFGEKVISEILKNLLNANIDIIECGFLRDVAYQKDIAVFSSVSQIEPFITPKKEGTLYVAMIALGDIAPENIACYDGKSIDGIRLTFHKHEWSEAKETAELLMEKGYQVFIQPVGTTSYSDEELLKLINEVNSIQPYAFYLVDTLGILYRKDLLRLFYLIEHNLDTGIKIGFHSHKNLQLSFANAQELLRLNSKRDIIIDTSVYGMGRGVGNLSTELLAEYINANIEQKYSISPLLTIADQYLMSIYAEQSWGYALPYFLSAIENCHPNYASYLIKKETLNIEDIFKILSLLPVDQRELYHPDLIEKLYLSFQSFQVDDKDTLEKIHKIVQGREVLVLAPGKTLKTNKTDIQIYMEKNHPIVISINFLPDELKLDMLFISNRKRIDVLYHHILNAPNVVATSNLIDVLPKTVNFVNYASYLGEGRAADNAGAILIRILKESGAKKILLGGFDGFDVDSTNNYCVDSYKTLLEKKVVQQKNEDIARQLKLAISDFSVSFLTPTKYIL